MQESESNISDPTAPVAGDVSVAPHAQAVDAAPSAVQPIIARAGNYYRNTRYIMAALTVVMGLWFGYDGFVNWPAENAKIAKLQAELANRDDATAAQLRTQLKDHTPHTETDLRLQRLLAFSLPPLGICLLLWALYNSRGEYRLAEEILYLPGHPPIPLAAIRELDQSAWERKGIARISYELSDAQAGQAKLDDFVYDRNPTDQIYDQIKSHLQPPEPASGGLSSAAGENVSAPSSQAPTD